MALAESITSVMKTNALLFLIPQLLAAAVRRRSAPHRGWRRQPATMRRSAQH